MPHIRVRRQLSSRGDRAGHLCPWAAFRSFVFCPLWMPPHFLSHGVVYIALLPGRRVFVPSDNGMATLAVSLPP